MSRKDTLRAILSQRSDKLPSGNSPSSPSVERPYVRSGAVGAMGRSLGQIATAADTARALIAAGSAVLDISPDKIEASFVPDRFGGDSPDQTALLESIRESGQQVPVLLRPHPDKSDHYQIAYGHRRVRALSQLQKPVRAVVRDLTDEELVIAQGQENAARTDLSFIERARFALALTDRGFNRAVIMSALNMEKTQLSKLMSIGRAIPVEIADAIGPAPKAGRPRWDALAERFMKGSRDEADKLLTDERFLVSDTDNRFNRVFEAMVPLKRSRLNSTTWKNDEGDKVAMIERSGTRVAVVVTDVKDFGEFIVERLPELYRAFQEKKAG